MPLAPRLEPVAHTFGKYKLARRLAVGGMGEVWLARNQTTGADVAVKLCRGKVATEEAALRFRHEARIGAKLSHRSIVRIFDLVEESDGSLLLVMELLRGETLERYLKTHGPLPTKDAVAIAIRVLSALAHAHDCGVVHRDVTPSNVFLAIDPDGHVIPKLVDFGIARLPGTGVRTLDGRALGTPRYMAPEQIRAQGEIDGRSDLFSVGVVIYEMLAGHCPFAANSPSASLAAVLEAVVDPDPRIEPRVWIELQRALAKRPYERHQGANEMAEALRVAAGISDAELAELVLQSPPSREEVTASSGSTRDIAAPSSSSVRAVGARRGLGANWIAAILLALGVVAGALAGLRGARAVAAASATSPFGSTGPGQPTPTRESTRLAPEPAASSPTSSASAMTAPPPANSPPNRPVHMRRVKPVATTPGF
jgi:eukaryotic-like serine/threonine-protein kinase